MGGAVVVLALLLTRPWGRRVPAWLLVLPMWVASGLLLPIMTAYPLQLAVRLLGGDGGRPAGGGAEPFLEPWVFGVVYGGFILQGLTLGALFTLYAGERWGALWRGGCGICRRARPPRPAGDRRRRHRVRTGPSRRTPAVGRGIDRRSRRGHGGRPYERLPRPGSGQRGLRRLRGHGGPAPGLPARWPTAVAGAARPGLGRFGPDGVLGRLAHARGAGGRGRCHGADTAGDGGDLRCPDAGRGARRDTGRALLRGALGGPRLLLRPGPACGRGPAPRESRVP